MDCFLAAAIDGDRSSEPGLILAKTDPAGMMLLAQHGAFARLGQFGRKRIANSRGPVRSRPRTEFVGENRIRAFVHVHLPRQVGRCTVLDRSLKGRPHFPYPKDSSAAREKQPQSSLAL